MYDWATRRRTIGSDPRRGGLCRERPGTVTVAATPPCGVSYLRASGSHGPYPLRATVAWKISWTSTTGEGGDLPDGTFGTTQDVTVREIQSVNR